MIILPGRFYVPLLSKGFFLHWGKNCPVVHHSFLLSSILLVFLNLHPLLCVFYNVPEASLVADRFQMQRMKSTRETFDLPTYRSFVILYTCLGTVTHLQVFLNVWCSCQTKESEAISLYITMVTYKGTLCTLWCRTEPNQCLLQVRCVFRNRKPWWTRLVRCLSLVINQRRVVREESKLPLLLPVDQAWCQAAAPKKETTNTTSLATERIKKPSRSPINVPCRKQTLPLSAGLQDPHQDNRRVIYLNYSCNII